MWRLILKRARIGSNVKSRRTSFFAGIVKKGLQVFVLKEMDDVNNGTSTIKICEKEDK